MQIELKDILTSVGPAASLIFASWIFLTLLNERYVSAYDRYRSLVTDYRDKHQKSEENQRRKSVREQIFLYKKRCEQMRLSMNLGLVAAMLLIAGLITAAIQIGFSSMPTLSFLKPVSFVCIIGGLALVIAAAVVVMLENLEIEKALNSEISDIADVKSATH